MSTYVYDELLLPQEALERVAKTGKVARINYIKKYGEEPPGWVIGYGRLEGRRFYLEGEVIARHLIINAKSYGMIAFQDTPSGETVDRGWILVPYTKLEFDGELCVIE
ncbi:MAG: hypothetical protein NZ988_03885 [Thaumarchaeota archaeon]|nr:hypothetical protein [Candidatus Calditenuaceae archaeon]MDW8187170.1 hypothetical protein [Nitrososphaerota archaeon]